MSDDESEASSSSCFVVERDELKTFRESMLAKKRESARVSN